MADKAMPAGPGANAKLAGVSAGFFVLGIVALVQLFAVGRGLLEDLAEVSQLSQVPCNMAAPSLKQLLDGLGIDGKSERARVADVTITLCGTDSVNTAVENLYINTFEPVEENTFDAAAAVCATSRVGGALLSDLEGGDYVDPLSRLTRGYMAANAAFTRARRRSHDAADVCSWPGDPFRGTAADCAQADTVVKQLDLAADEQYLTYQTDLTAAQMIYRLAALGVLLYHDDKDNSGRCFGNPDKQLLRAFCTNAYNSSYLGYAAGEAPPPPAPPPPGATPPLYTGADDYGWQNLYHDANEEYHLLLENARCEGANARTPPPSPPPTPLVSTTGDATWAAEGAVLHCVYTHARRAHDVVYLFGMPDYGREAPTRFRTDNLFTFVTNEVFAAQAKAYYSDERTGYAVSTPQRDHALYVVFRGAAALPLLVAALACAGFWTARGALPLLACLTQTLVALSNKGTQPEVLAKPGFSGVTFLAVLASALTWLFVAFSDQTVPTAIYGRGTCDAASAGQPYATSAGVGANLSLAALFLALLAAASLVYDTFLRNKAGSIGPQQRVAAGLLQACLLAVVLALIFDILLVVESAEEYVKELQTQSNNYDTLRVRAELYRKDAVNLFFTASCFSFALGAITCRWAFLPLKRAYKACWVGTIAVALGLPFLLRLQSCEEELKVAWDFEESWVPRIAAHWTIVAVSAFLGLSLIFFSTAPLFRASVPDKVEKKGTGQGFFRRRLAGARASLAGARGRFARATGRGISVPVIAPPAASSACTSAEEAAPLLYVPAPGGAGPPFLSLKA